MKIIIVGAGVAGLSTYLQLRKLLPSFDSHTVVIYDSHKPPSRRTVSQSSASPLEASPSGPHVLTDAAAVVGNSIALAPRSVHLLGRIDSTLHDLFTARGYANEHFTFKTARGRVLAVTSTADARFPGERTISCPRHVLWECLHEVVGEDRVQHRQVASVDLDGPRPVVRFAEGGGQEEADLVIGADGVRSVVKRALFGEDDETRYAPRFEGFCGVGAFVDCAIPETVARKKSMVFTFGPSGSFGYCSAAPEEQHRLGWWSNWGRSSIPDGNVVDPEEVRKGLRERHGSWKDPVIQRILHDATTDRIYPIWTTPHLPFWGRRGAVLLGDAAHTLQATSGQGAGQALEDGVTFSLLLAHYVSKTGGADGRSGGLTIEQAVERAAEGLYQIRCPRVSIIRDRARNLYLSNRRTDNVVVEYLHYALVFLWANFPILGRLIVGNVFWEWQDGDPDAQVRSFLRQRA